MNIFDQILASAYYVFESELNPHIVRHFITLMRKAGYHFNRNDLKMGKIKDFIYFDNQHYVLKDGYLVSDISDFINFDMVAIFHNIKISRDKYYSNSHLKEEPSFEKGMQKIMRKSYEDKSNNIGL